MATKCAICNCNCTNLKRHLHRKHKNINYEDYFKEHLADYNFSLDKVKCEICNTYHGDNNLLAIHIKSVHNYTTKQYTLDYILKTSETSSCLHCGNPPAIKYIHDNNQHLYYPDFLINTFNLVIEIKSTWILEKQGLEKNLSKFDATKKEYKFLLVLDNIFDQLKQTLTNLTQ